MKANNIKPIRLPPVPKEVKLDGINDPKLPKQIAKDLAGRDDVLEIHQYLHPQERSKEYRIKLKSSDAYNICIFYTAIYQSCSI